MQIQKILSAVGMLVGSASLAFTMSAQAGSIVLEGSDATGFHGHQTGGPEYTTQLFTYLKGASSLPVLVFGTAGATPEALPDTVFTSDLSGLSIGLYSAVYIQSPTGCCDQNLSGASAYSAQIGSFVAAGGSIAIMNYQGGDWSFVDPILATPTPGSVMGYNTGGGGPSCTDAEVFNTEALIRGFTQPPALGCWEHQAYSMSYFGALGFISLVDADPSYFGVDNAGKPLGSALLAYGGAIGTPGCTNPAGCDPVSTPEPESLALFGAALLGLGAVSRRRKLAA